MSSTVVNSYVYVFYPNKPIPSWLVEIKFTQPQLQTNPHVAHDGFGIVISWKGNYYIYLAKGNLIKMVRCNDIDITWISNPRMSMTVFSLIKDIYINRK